MRWFNKADSSFNEEGTYGDMTEFRCVDNGEEWSVEYVIVNGSTVEYDWEKKYWGGSDMRNDVYNFFKFVRLWKSGSLKDY